MRNISFLSAITLVAFLSLINCTHAGVKGAEVPVRKGPDTDLAKVLGLGYETCTDCPSELNPERRDLISAAVRNGNTEVLIRALDQLKTPMTTADHRFLDRVLVDEMRKGPLCDVKRIIPLARKGATVEIDALEVYGPDLVYCSDGFSVTVLPYYIMYRGDDEDEVLAFLMHMQHALAEASRNWDDGALAALDGIGISDFNDGKRGYVLLKRYVGFTTTLNDLIHLLEIKTSKGRPPAAVAILADLSRMLEYNANMGRIFATARDKYHPKDERTSTYNAMIKLFDELSARRKHDNAELKVPAH